MKSINLPKAYLQVNSAQDYSFAVHCEIRSGLRESARSGNTSQLDVLRIVAALRSKICANHWRHPRTWLEDA